MSLTTHLWIGVHLPQANLDLSCPHWRDKPVVVLDNRRARLLSPLASQAGIRIHMQPGSIRALCPDALLIAYQPPLDQQALRKAALALLQYTPEVALTDQHSLLLNVTASLRLFRGARQLCRQIGLTLHKLGLTVRISTAPTAMGAWLLAIHAPARQRRCIKPASLHKRLDTLPCSSLPATRPYADWLNTIGCHTLGDLRRLPRAGLKRRTHADILHILDQARDDAHVTFNWFVPPPRFFRREQLPEHTEHMSILLLLGQRLLEQASGWLTSVRLAASQILFSFEYEQRQQTLTPTHLPISLVQPSWRVDDMLTLYQEHLRHLQPAAPVTAITLRINETQPMRDTVPALFPDPASAAINKQQLLELFCIRLGHDRVLQATPMDDHRPEIANRWTPVSLASQNVIWPINNPRPFWLLDTPIPLSVSQHRPFYKSALRLVQGPERIEDGWWDQQPVRRDYFIAQANDGSRYWLFQDSIGGGWFLHGLFA